MQYPIYRGARNTLTLNHLSVPSQREHATDALLPSLKARAPLILAFSLNIVIETLPSIYTSDELSYIFNTLQSTVQRGRSRRRISSHYHVTFRHRGHARLPT